MLLTQKVGRRSQCDADMETLHVHIHMETLHTNQTWRQMEIHGDMWRHTETHGDMWRHTETHRDMETLHTKSIHRLKLIFMML